ncbi:MAG: type II toxin-antitoxin system HicB family antitoxin [Desulfamplus sp.]|nr:type II toxin-antitoxin system HicB family antitoxin [Desulfamplus sp.]
MTNYFYKVIIAPQEEGGFTAYIPSLPGCVSEGETYDETVYNIKEALTLYVETLKMRQNQMIEDRVHITEMCVSL